MLVHQVNVTEVDVSAEIDLWQRSVSHDQSKLNICIFDVYVCIYNITYIYIGLPSQCKPGYWYQK